MGGRDLGRSPADNGRFVGERRGQYVIVQPVQPLQRAERRRPYGRIVRRQTGAGAWFVALMACERDGSPRDHDKRPLSVVKRKISAPAIAVAVSTPSTIPIAGRPTNAASRSHQRGGR